jgi:predicted nucleic acid-binding protein
MPDGAITLALKAKFVISGDKALKAIQDYMNIKIVSSREFLSKFTECIGGGPS